MNKGSDKYKHKRYIGMLTATLAKKRELYKPDYLVILRCFVIFYYLEESPSCPI